MPRVNTPFAQLSLNAERREASEECETTNAIRTFSPRATALSWEPQSKGKETAMEMKRDCILKMPLLLPGNVEGAKSLCV
mmetsp:Transcript_20729/g.41361  ORF Transcript_20729/g.41361 Transcript_20729/m.41361 type:complete len:80 (+) Transcript_20729:521-760(+)